MTLSPKFNKFVMIMLFYVFLAHILFPVAFYYLVNRSLLSAGNGFVFGSVVSILLWYGFGSKMV